MAKQTYATIPFYMTAERAVEQLNALPVDDEEMSHVKAEEILCELLRSQGMAEVAIAFDAAVRRCGFWYS